MIVPIIILRGISYILFYFLPSSVMLIIFILIYVSTVFRKSRLLGSVGVTRATKLTPKARKLYEVAVELKKVNTRLAAQNMSTKDRISKAIDFSESVDFLKTKCSGIALNFINCQLRILSKSARRRRFTFNDKVFALSLLKQSPKAYKVLRATFALPSRRTLMNILNKVQFTTGIVPKVMQTLQHSVEKLNFLDRQCILIWWNVHRTHTCIW